RGLHAESPRERARGVEGGPGQAALTVQRLSGRPADGAPGPGGRQADHEAVPAQLDPVGKGRDRQVRRAAGDRLDEGTGVGRGGAEVSVQEEEVTRPVSRTVPVDRADRL